MKRYRVGKSWGVTIVETDNDLPEDNSMRHENDRLMAMASSEEYAQEIVAALNARARGES